MQIFKYIDRQKNQAYFIYSSGTLFSGHTVRTSYMGGTQNLKVGSEFYKREGVKFLIKKWLNFKKAKKGQKHPKNKEKRPSNSLFLF